MKKILITGANSYIGTSFEKYIHDNFPEEYSIDTVDMLDGTWRQKSFAGYDSVFHVAGIAHQKETKRNAHLYYEVNRDLTTEVAKKAKSDGVGQFIFLSSMSVYGMDTGVITKETQPQPKSHYGKSKWQAEQEIAPLDSEDFKVCILRPPMVYGKGCKGNFQTIVKIVKVSPVFPNVENERSMICIDNLSSFVEMAISRCLAGTYFPQNREYVSTLAIAREIAEVLGKRILFGFITGFGMKLFRSYFPLAKKAFGTLIYRDVEGFSFSYIVEENTNSFKKCIL